MNKLIFYSLTLLILCFSSCNAQNQSSVKEKASNEEFDKLIKTYLNFSIPVISVKELHENYSDYVLLDAREQEEFNISHLPSAKFIGYNTPDWTVLDSIDKQEKIVVYCSIGYRSEKIAEKIEAKGYNVRNLYGSIFEWVNSSYQIQSNPGTKTQKLHSYNKSWSKWISNPSIEIIY